MPSKSSSSASKQASSSSTTTKAAAQPAPKYLPASTAEEAKQQHITPTTQPVPGPTTALGAAYTNLHPVLVLTYFLQRFPALVADPVSAMVRDLAVLSVAQGAYAVLCLPPTAAAPTTGSRDGSGSGGGSGDKGARKTASGRGKNRTREADVGLGARISTALLSLLLTFTIGVPVLFCGLVLLGGPLTTHHAETALCAAHIAALAAPPLFYTRGVQPRAWREVAALLLPGDAVWGGSLGAVVGAWLGAVPIPLDWDRAWQRWPVTIVAGAYAGWAAGRILGEYVFPGKRVSMDAE